MSYYGNLILRERLARSWSQAGLCKDICTVSYLSKIETGKAQPAADVLRLLLAPLHLFTKLPVVHGVNAILGGALGLVKGALLLFFAVWLLRRFQILVTPELIGQTYILRFFAEHSPMELITSL